MFAWFVNLFLSPEFFGGLALLAGAGYVYFKVTLNPLLALVCEVACVCLLVATAYAWAENRGYARGHAEAVAIQTEYDAFVQRTKDEAAEQKREWAAATNKAEADARKRKEKKDASFAALKRHVDVLPGSVGGVRVPGGSLGVVGLLDAGARAANAAGAPAQPDPAPAPDPADSQDTTLEALTSWQLEVLEIHAECRDTVASWATWYDALRSTHQTGAPQ